MTDEHRDSDSPPGTEWTAGGATTPAFLTFRKVAAAIFGVLALALLAFLGLGFFLSGEWEARATGSIDAPPAVVYAALENPARWGDWTQWGDLEGESFGPATGEGAGWRWNDDRYGQGALTVTAADPHGRIAYQVEIEEGSLIIEGTITLAGQEGGGTGIVWTESGDFGNNPLMGYVARTMPSNQRAQLEGAIRRLNQALSPATAPTTPGG